MYFITQTPNTKHGLLVYDLKIIGPLESKLVAPMKQLIKPKKMKCIAVVPICSGIGAMEINFMI